MHQPLLLELDLDPMEKVRVDANRALAAGPFAVTFKSFTPPSGDKHDYVSLAKYWWPDSANPGGPYVRHDGQINPEWASFDRVPMGKMCDAVAALALANHAQPADALARHAAMLLRTWFLDPATRMNPHLRFAQFVPGVVEGRGLGIIDTACLAWLLDAVSLLREDAPAVWTATDHSNLLEWFARYTDWLITSDAGREEAAAENNHGNWYDVQIVAFLLHLGRADEAEQILRTQTSQRIAKQVAPDGSQPLELARQTSLHYVVYNVYAMIALARLADRTRFDLASTDALRRAVRWLLPYLQPGVHWPYPQITPFEDHDRAEAVKRFAAKRLA